MNICFVIGTLNYSGAEKIVRHLIDKLCEQNNKVSVMLLSCDKPIETVPTKVTQFPLYINPETNKISIIRVIKRLQAIRKIVKKNKFDIVVSFGVVFNMDIALAMLGAKTKLVLCERNDPVFDPRKKLQRLRRRITYPFADGFVFQTEVIKEFFPSKIQMKSVVIPNFIEARIPCTELYSPNRNAWATSARLDDNQKSQKKLFDAFAIFVQKHPDYRLELYGDGSDKDMLKEYAIYCGIQKEVIFHGRVANPMQYIRNCRGFILTSKYEGMPNALIEAMAHGMPCVSTDCSGGGARALIRNYDNGILVENGAPEEIAEAMSKIADDNELANKLGKNAFKINDDLQIDKIISLWTDYFESIIAN